jgi:nucleotide-binding universal stress UspA family protein
MITIKRILVPCDLTTVSVPAIGYAISLAQHRDAEVILLNVQAMEAMKKQFTGSYGEGLALTTGAPLPVQQQPDIDNFYEQKKQFLVAFVQQKIAPELRTTVKMRALVKLGKVAEEILATAREEQCDLIVMASQGGRLRRFFGGTISERIVRYAPCPVLTMQPSAHIRIEEDQRLEVKQIEQWAA